MKRSILQATVLLAFLGLVAGTTAQAADKTEGLKRGTPDIKSISAMSFGAEGVLFIGDGKGGAVFALDLEDRKARGKTGYVELEDIEGKIAALLGTKASEIMVHDMAVNPISQNIYIAVSRGRGKWDSQWILPNDIADAEVLLRIGADSKIELVPLDKVLHARAPLPNPVAPGKKHRWKEGIQLRADTITDIAFSDGTLYVAGLSNEEFASTMWRMPYPFRDHVSATTLEVFHGAHGEYETHAPIRTFVPYRLSGRDHLLAAYLCTPLATFPMDDLKDGGHVKGRTIGELGSGNYPLDMVVYQKNGRDRLLIANSNLPLMIVEPESIEAYKGSITKEVEGYLDGVEYEFRSGTGILQMDQLNSEYFVALQRQSSGTMNLVSLAIRRF